MAWTLISTYHEEKIPFYSYLHHIPGADPGFPVGGGANPPGGRQHMILPNIPKNCMKLRKFWAVEGARRGRPRPPDPPLYPFIYACRNHFSWNYTSHSEKQSVLPAQLLFKIHVISHHFHLFFLTWDGISDYSKKIVHVFDI